MRRNRRTATLAFGVALALSALVRADGRQASSSRDWNPELGLVMAHHYREVSGIHDAVIRGDLIDAHERAKALAAITDPPTNVPSSTEPVMAIRRAATRVATARTVDEAATGTAAMLVQCGTCHVSRGVRPSPDERPTPPLGGIVGHMVDHSRAVRGLLEGLVIPSDSEWLRGAELLKVRVLQDVDLPSDPQLAARAAATERTLHALSAVAASARTRDTRAAAYAQVIATCATCHALHPAIWGPGQGVRAGG